MAAFSAYAGVDVLLRNASEAEGRRRVTVGDDGRLVGPDVSGRLPVFAELDAHLSVGDGGPVDLRRLADDFRGLGSLHAASAVVTCVGAGAQLGHFGFRDGRKGGGEASGDFFRRDKGAM